MARVRSRGPTMCVAVYLLDPVGDAAAVAVGVDAAVAVGR